MNVIFGIFLAGVSFLIWIACVCILFVVYEEFDFPKLFFESVFKRRKHGYWLVKSVDTLECSSCGSPVPNYHIAGMNYCPVCGAKMDEH